MNGTAMGLRDSGAPVERISVFLLCRDNETYLRYLLSAFRQLESAYACSFEYFFLENGSTDRTPDLIRTFLHDRSGRLIVPGNTAELDRMPRMERMARLRNTLLASIRPLTSDYALLLDTDVYFNRNILAELFALSPSRENLAMLCAYGTEAVPAQGRWSVQRHYYDTAAFLLDDLRLHWPNCLFDDCMKCTERVDSARRIGKQPLLRVKSAFGGFALVRSPALNDDQVRWGTQPLQDLMLCEHLQFCRTLGQSTGQGVAVACDVPVYWDCTSRGL